MFLLFSLLAAATAGVVNFADKGFLGKYEIGYKAASIFGAVAGGVLALLILPFSNLSSLSLAQIVIIIASGSIFYASYFTYWNMMSRTNASTVIVLIQLIPAAVLVLGALFLNEYLSSLQFLGFILILGSVVLFTIEGSGGLKKIEFNGILIIGSLSALFAAIGAVVQRYAVEHTSVHVGVALEGLGVFVAGALVFATFGAIREDVYGVARRFGFRPFIYIFTVEAVWLGYRFLSYGATKFGPVAVERALEGTRVFFGLLYGAVLSRAVPKIYVTERTNITTSKMVLAIVLVLGIYLIS